MEHKFSFSKIRKLAVILTCFNRRLSTLKSLQFLIEQDIFDKIIIDIFLVDDGSIDCTEFYVRKKFPNVKILKGNGNLFWCGGMRLAWSEASKENYDAYLWLNDDTMLLPGSLRTIIETSEKVVMDQGCDGIIIGSCCDPITGKHTYGGRVCRRLLSRLPDQPLVPSDRILSCDTMNGNLVLVPQSVFKILGNLSEKFIHAFGDTDYGMRARKKNIPICIAPGYLATCPANERVSSWTDPSVPLLSRWKIMCSPLGLPPSHWLYYVRSHTGYLWPLYCIKPFIRLLIPRLWYYKNNLRLKF